MSQENANVTLKGFENMVISEYRTLKCKILMGLKVFYHKKKKRKENCVFKLWDFFF
jgi:hypothetical protein